MKRFIFLFVFMIASTVMMSQEHLEFKGIPMDGPVSSFVSKLKTKGFTEVYNSGFNYVLKGEFTGKSATLFVLGSRKTGIVWKVGVNFEKETSWYTIKSLYNKYVNLFKEKYGSPTEHFEFFSDPYYEGDGYEMQALRNEKCSYASYFKTAKGMLCVSLSTYECLQLGYEDGINAKISEKENNSSNLDDI